jgi:hypothetical protein
MNKAKVANGIVGYMKQFAALDLNNLKPDIKRTFTKTVYFLQEPRLIVKKNNIFHAYTLRSDNRGINAGIYNIEELATIWHFPVEANVKASMVQKAPGRKADAPSSLPLASDLVAPTESFFKTGIFTSNQGENNNKQEKELETLDNINATPPDNLPFV